MALGIQIVVQLWLFSPTLTPRLLCSLLSTQELTSPLLSLAAQLSSHFHLSMSQRDGRMLKQTGNLRPPPPSLSLPLQPSLSLFHFPCHPFISSDLSSTPIVSHRVCSPRAPASFSRSLMACMAAGSSAVLEAAWGLRSHLVLSRAKPSFRKAS